jgi:hypothetical protein
MYKILGRIIATQSCIKKEIRSHFYIKDNNIQRKPVKKILKIPRKSYFLSRKFLKRVILMKWENFGAFLSLLLRQEIFLTGFFLSKFHCISHVYHACYISHLS